MLIRTFRRQSPPCMAIGLMQPSFFCRDINLPPYKISFISAGNSPANCLFTKSLRATVNLLSVLSVIRSFRCCGVIPSGPPDDPVEKVCKAFLTSVISIWRGVNLGSEGSLGISGLMELSDAFAAVLIVCLYYLTPSSHLSTVA